MNYNVIADSLKESFLIRKKKSLLLTAVATLGLTAATMAQSVPSYVPTNGLVGWWPFNGNANDERGSGNNGTVNGATLTLDRYGNVNSAYGFSNSNIEVNHNSLFGFNQNGSFTVSFWYNSNSSDPLQHLIGKRPLNSNIFNWQFLWMNPSLSFGSGIGVNYYDGVFSNQNLEIGIWTNVIGIYYNGAWNIYFNGVLNSTSNGIFASPDIPCSLFFGNSGNNIGFNGDLDDIGIWNRALTQQEITALYNGCQLSVNTQPINQTININNNAEFTVGSSDPNATYQWQTDLGVGFQNLNSVGQYNGTTNDTLIVSNVTISNNNQPLRCIISSGSCSDTSNVAVLTVINNVGINETNQGNLFSVFPNPAQSIINVKTDSKLIGSAYSIFDNKGRVVQTGKISSENTTIELSNFSSGIYMFNVGENMKQSFKVIKE